MGVLKRQLQTSGLCRLDNCNFSEQSSTSRNFIKPNCASRQRSFATIVGFCELQNAHFWLSIISECLSCYLYVFVVCTTRISWTGSIIGHEPSLVAMSLASGIAMALLIFTFRTVHVNPALTMAFLLTGRISIVRALLYLVVHCLASIAAIVSLYSVSVEKHSGALGLDDPHEALVWWQVLVVEIVISFVVTLTTFATCNFSSYSGARKFVLDQLARSSGALSSDLICDTNSVSDYTEHPIVPNARAAAADLQATSKKPRSTFSHDENSYDEYDNHHNLPQVAAIEELLQDESQILIPNGFSIHVTWGQSLLIGLAYTLVSLGGIPASGASLNPARSFGPAFIMNHWDNHWIYWLGPISGAVIAGFFYEFVLNPTRTSSFCYRPKLFRFNAFDLAKVGAKSRLYQHRNQIFAPSTAVHPSGSLHRPAIQTIDTLHNWPQLRPASGSVKTQNFLQPSSGAQSYGGPHLRGLHPMNAPFDSINYLNQGPPSQFEQPDFDGTYSTAAMVSTLERGPRPAHLSTMNIARNNNVDFGKFADEEVERH